MRTAVRFLLAFILSLLIELGFIEILESLKKPEREEVRRVIKISLIKQKEQRVEVKREIRRKERRRLKRHLFPKRNQKSFQKSP